MARLAAGLLGRGPGRTFAEGSGLAFALPLGLFQGGPQTSDFCFQCGDAAGLLLG
jgi:hypothetical protein